MQNYTKERETHILVSWKTQKPHINVEHKNHTQTLNTKNHRLKPHGKQYNHTPTDQRV